MSPDALLAYLCHEMVGPAYAMRITEGEVTLLIELTAPDASMPRLLGRRQQMLMALRTLAMAVGWKHGLRVYVTLEAAPAVESPDQLA